MYAECWTDSNSSIDSQPMKINTHARTIKAQIHTPPTTTVLDTENSYQNVNIEFQNDSFVSQHQDISLPKYEVQESQDCRTHDDQQIVMANDEAFGALDSQTHDTIPNAANEFLQQLPLTPPDRQLTYSLHDTQMPKDNTQNDGGAIHDIVPNDIPPDVSIFDHIPLPPIQDHELDSDVEDEPHLEPKPQLIQQRDNITAVDPVPESRYNLQNKN